MNSAYTRGNGMTKVLLHICCSPCSIYPIKCLKENKMEVLGYFYNPNIHPYQEYKRRRDAVQSYADLIQLPVIYRDEYNMEEFLQHVVFREKSRCHYCYHSRLESAARIAVQEKIPQFTSSILYSRYQNHQLIKEIGESLAKQYGLKFYYEDFRKGWSEGIETSRRLSLYRQQYCGCIYSEKERYIKAGKLLPNSEPLPTKVVKIQPAEKQRQRVGRKKRGQREGM